MSNPTSNFNWQMPTSSDLVTDLPADFEVFGQAVDTSLADLKGGTTGQVLKKNTDADMDFVWAADSAGMTNPMTTTGDTIYSSSGSTPARLGIGSTGQVLTVAGGVPTWATGGASKTWTLLSTTSMSGSASVTVSGISDKEDLLILVVGATFGTAARAVRFRINGDTGTNYIVQQNSSTPSSTYAASDYNGFNSNTSYVPLATTSQNASSAVNASIVLSGCKSTGIKNIDYAGGATAAGSTDHTLNWGQGIYSGSAAVTNITVYQTSYAFTAGTIYIYGA